MTIAAGFVCDDGIVLGADMLYSGRSSRHGLKVWHVPLEGKKLNGCGFAMTGAGSGPTLWSVRERLATCKPSAPTLRAISEALEERLSDFYHRHGASLRNQSLELLVAIYASDGLGLYLSENSSVLGPVEEFACVGSDGSVLGSWIARQFHKVGAPIQAAVSIAGYLLNQVMLDDPDTGHGDTICLIVPTAPHFRSTDDRNTLGGSMFLADVMMEATQLAMWGLDRSKEERKRFGKRLARFNERVREAHSHVDGYYNFELKKSARK